MAKRATNIPTFNPKDTLKSIRENSLNPVIQRLNTVEATIDGQIIPTMKGTYNNVKFDESSRILSFEKVGKLDTPPLPDTTIDLSSIVPKYAGIDIQGYKDTTESPDMPGSGDALSISKIKFHNAVITKGVGADAYSTVDFQWNKIVPQFESKQTAKIKDLEAFQYTSFEINGEGKDIFHKHVNTDGSIALTVDMPKIPEVQTAIIGRAPTPDPSKPFTKIKIVGNIGGSNITQDGELQIDLPAGGGVTPFGTGHFKGFFGSLGDLETIPASQLVPDRSSAYVKSEIKQVVIYTLYMYKGPSEILTDKWKPVTTRPPLIYNGSGSSPDQAILSVKYVDGVIVSADGELDLNALKNKGGEGNNPNFKGVYDTIDQIKAIENPISNKSYAMLSNDSKHGLLPYIYRPPTGKVDPEWVLAPALGHLMGVGLGTTVEGYKPIYGIKPAGAPISSNGVLDLAKATTRGTLKMTVTSTGTPATTSGEIRSLRFPVAAAEVEIDPGTKIATVYPAQRNIPKIDQTWMDAHDGKDYLGRLYYDVDTGRWMGMTDKNIASTEEEWTPVIHRNMSLDVTDQNYRYGRRIPQVVLIGESKDHERWEYAGKTWVNADFPDLPATVLPKHGGIITTEVWDDVSFPTGKETRSQTLVINDGTGRTYARVYDKGGSTTAGKTVWTNWIRTNYLIDDFKAHEIDPSAHSVTHRFFRTTMVDFVWSQGPSDGILDRTHVYTFTDSYGHSHKSDKPGSIPYGGNFRMGMSVHFEGYRERPQELPKGSWVITLIKHAKATGAETDIGAWEHKHEVTGAKEFKHFQFMQENISFDTDDQVKVKMEWIPIAGTGKEALTTAAPMLRIMGTRSMIILEDMNTVSATLVGNALTKFLGRTLDRGNVATHTHFTGADESETATVRTYAEKIDSHFVNMTPKT